MPSEPIQLFPDPANSTDPVGKNEPSFSVSKEQWDGINSSIGELKGMIVSMNQNLRPASEPEHHGVEMSVPEGYEDVHKNYGSFIEKHMLLPAIEKTRAEFRQAIGAMADRLDADSMQSRPDFERLEPSINSIRSEFANKGTFLSRADAYVMALGRNAESMLNRETVHAGEMGLTRGNMPQFLNKDPKQMTDAEQEEVLRAAVAARYKF